MNKQNCSCSSNYNFYYDSIKWDCIVKNVFSGRREILDSCMQIHISWNFPCSPPICGQVARFFLAGSWIRSLLKTFCLLDTFSNLHSPFLNALDLLDHSVTALAFPRWLCTLLYTCFVTVRLPLQATCLLHSTYMTVRFLPRKFFCWTIFGLVPDEYKPSIHEFLHLVVRAVYECEGYQLTSHCEVPVLATLAQLLSRLPAHRVLTVHQLCTDLCTVSVVSSLQYQKHQLFFQDTIDALMKIARKLGKSWHPCASWTLLYWPRLKLAQMKWLRLNSTWYCVKLQ